MKMKVPQFASVLQVQPHVLENLGDEELSTLMDALLTAEVRLCGGDVAKVRVNSQSKARDKGQDGWSPNPPRTSAWLKGDTCWQFKSGKDGEPANLKGEVVKEVPAATLKAGGWFVVVASACSNGKTGEDARLESLKADAVAHGIPSTHIEVIGADRLARWCNGHPAVAMQLSNAPESIMAWNEWCRQKVHSLAWHPSKKVEERVAHWREQLAFGSGEVAHLHLHGPPGVGKTRMALELCRGASWRDFVVYVEDASKTQVSDMLAGAARNAGVHMVLIADEVESQDLDKLCSRVEGADGRVKLITIGHGGTTDPTRIPSQEVEPLPEDVVLSVIADQHQGMPQDQRRFVASFSGGYVRLAILAANALAAGGTAVNVRGLLDQAAVRGFLDSMLGERDRGPLYVVACLTRVGWQGDKEPEGEAIAKQLGMQWPNVKTSLQAFHTILGIVPTAGDYRYISPKPLALYLAAEAWDAFRSQLRDLEDVLPSEAARDAYFARIAQMASSPAAREYAREELRSFLSLSDLSSARPARRWAALAAADPELASRNVRVAIEAATPEERVAFAGRPRRELIWALVKLAWRTTCFRDAVLSLALLAEAENESWSNNATGEFVDKYQIVLGGTAVPYLDRLVVLDDLLALKRDKLTTLVIKALACAGADHYSRAELGAIDDAAREAEWHPSDEQGITCVIAALDRLNTLADTVEGDVFHELESAVGRMLDLVRANAYRHSVGVLARKIVQRNPVFKRTVRKQLSDIIRMEESVRDRIDPKDLDAVRLLWGEFADNALGERLREAMATSVWTGSGEKDFSPLAQELIAKPDELGAHLPWLLSGEAGEAWTLGRTLAREDLTGTLDQQLMALADTGRDHRLLAGYVKERRSRLGDDWYEAWCRRLLSAAPPLVGLFVEMLWRCDATNGLVADLAKAVRGKLVKEADSAVLGHGHWGAGIARERMSDLLEAMIDLGHLSTAVSVLAGCIKRDGLDAWRSLAELVALRPQLIRSKGMTSHYWKEIAENLVPTSAGTLADAIVGASLVREGDEDWFLQFNDAGLVLAMCAEAAPREVWGAIRSRIRDRAAGYMLSVGFPEGIMGKLPVGEVMDWVGESPEERGPVVARLSRMDFSTDETLASRLLGRYAQLDGVARACSNAVNSGAWMGKSSDHWDTIAESLEAAASRTALAGLRVWATVNARALRDTAAHERKRETEEELDRA